jgi:hypothetical protein
MQAFLAILQYDVTQLARSWLVRIWVLLLIVPALFLVVVGASEEELASEVMGLYIAAVLAPLSGLAVAIVSTAAISGEAAIVADSILSRSVTRTEYMAAKIISRLGITAGIYVVVTVPFAYLVVRYASHDASIGGVAAGLMMVGVLLIFLAAFGITMSTVLSNVLVAVLAVLLTVMLSGALLQFLGLTWMSTTAVVEALPETFRGETATFDEVRVLLVFPMLTAASLATAFIVFRQKDL